MQPWEDSKTPWKNQSQFMSFLRGVLRRGWKKHPVKLNYIRSVRFKAPIGARTKRNPSGNVWAVVCEGCGETFRESQTVVDHINQCGSFIEIDDIQDYVVNLMFVTEDDLQCLCKDCHDVKTHSERQGISLEEARIEKEIIAYEKKLGSLLKQHLLDKGFSKEQVRNKETRRQCIREVLDG